jgi:tetratricopeptide (TPR) repeat protein
MFASLYTGGSEPPEPKPFYSIAEGRRKRGQYQEAIAEVQRQLALFPTDVTGWLLLAEIQAEDLKDLASADATVEQFLAQPDHAPRNIAFALSRQADWRLKVAQDRDGARAALERIVELLPETEQAQNALQRIAHLTPAEMLLGRQKPQRISVPHQQENLGLRQEPLPKPAEEDPAVTAAQYVKHLDEFPFDNEAREKLALVYARHYQRLDLATDQLEQLVSVPNQPAKLVVRWLNQIADLQLELASDEAQARETLQRIIELYPKTAAAETARNRLAHLKLEMRPKQVSQAVKLGSYEQNLGLRERPAEPQAE